MTKRGTSEARRHLVEHLEQVQWRDPVQVQALAQLACRDLSHLPGRLSFEAQEG